MRVAENVLPTGVVGTVHDKANGSAAAVPVAVKVIAVIPDTVAVTVFVPAVEPSVSVDEARPLAFVVTLEDADSVPPPTRHGKTLRLHPKAHLRFDLGLLLRTGLDKCGANYGGLAVPTDAVKRRCHKVFCGNGKIL